MTECGSSRYSFPIVHDDPLGRRVRASLADPADNRAQWSAASVYDGWNLVREDVTVYAYVSLLGSQTLTAAYPVHYVWGNDLSGTPQGAGGVGGLLAAVRSSASSASPFFACCDANGNVTEYVSAGAALTARYEYDAFGNITAQSGPMAGDFRHRFSTKYYDPETGHSYYIGRCYDPVLGCWLSSDPIGTKGGLNLYGFCGNDPINHVDYLGLTKYWDNYMNYTAYPSSTKVWDIVGGELRWLHYIETSVDIKNYYNSCALRVSRTIIKSGYTISKADGALHINNDYKARHDVSYNGNTIKKDEILKAENPGAYYVLAASRVEKMLTNVLGKNTTSWDSLEELKKFIERVDKCDLEAFFVAPGHVGMLKKGYLDPHVLNYNNGKLWFTKKQ